VSHLLPSRSRFVLDPGIAAVAAVRIPSSAAGGKESAYIHEGLIRLAANSGSTISTTATATPAATPGPITAKERPRASAPSTEEKLFNALAAAKILTSQVAMHLDDGWRKKLFRRLDDLLSVDSWDEADQALQRDSLRRSFAFSFCTVRQDNPALAYLIVAIFYVIGPRIEIASSWNVFLKTSFAGCLFDIWKVNVRVQPARFL